MQFVGKRIRFQQRETIAGWIFATPAILGLIIFYVGPMLASLGMSFTDWRVGSTPHWVGLANYQAMFTTDLFFWVSLRVTALYTLGSVPLGLAVAFAMAMLLNVKTRGERVFRTIFYVPAIVPTVASAVVWLWVFHSDFGLFNFILSWFGIPGQRWLYSTTLVIPSLIIMSTWGAGSTMVIFLAGLQGIPAHLYEAVSVDGGNAWHRFRVITLPMMTPVIFFNLIMGLISAFQSFTQAYIMTQGGPANASLFYVYYLYRTAFRFAQMGFASGLAWVLFLIIAAITALVFRSSGRWVYYEGASD